MGIPLVQDACHDDVRASFERWVEPHLPAMWALASRLAGPRGREDVYQDALLTAWRRRATFDASRGAPRTWLLVLVADRCRKHRRTEVVLYSLDESHREGTTAAADVEARLDLAHAIAGLPPRQRQAIELHYLLDLPVAEAALVMRCTPGTVTSTLTDARRSLRARLGSAHA